MAKKAAGGKLSAFPNPSPAKLCPADIFERIWPEELAYLLNRRAYRVVSDLVIGQNSTLKRKHQSPPEACANSSESACFLEG